METKERETAGKERGRRSIVFKRPEASKRLKKKGGKKGSQVEREGGHLRCKVTVKGKRGNDQGENFFPVRWGYVDVQKPQRGGNL